MGPFEHFSNLEHNPLIREAAPSCLAGPWPPQSADVHFGQLHLHVLITIVFTNLLCWNPPVLDLGVTRAHDIQIISIGTQQGGAERRALEGLTWVDGVRRVCHGRVPDWQLAAM